jgi:hypothetical protein
MILTIKPAMESPDDWKNRIADSDRRLKELQHTLAQTRSDYDLAKIEHEKAQELLRDIGGFDNPDGATAIRRAQKNYRLSFEQYRNALHQYSKFILGKSD